MLNTNDSQSIEWFIDEKIKPLKKEIKKLQLENKELNEKFSLYGVSQQRELLEAYQHFIDWNEEHDRKASTSKRIDAFIASNCG